MQWHVGVNKRYGCIVASQKQNSLYILGSTPENVKKEIEKYDVRKPINDLGTSDANLRNLTDEEYKQHFG